MQDEQYTKDTHVDLAMDMWITHNKSKLTYSTSGYANSAVQPNQCWYRYGQW